MIARRSSSGQSETWLALMRSRELISDFWSSHLMSRNYAKPRWKPRRMGDRAWKVSRTVIRTAKPVKRIDHKHDLEKSAEMKEIQTALWTILGLCLGRLSFAMAFVRLGPLWHAKRSQGAFISDLSSPRSGDKLNKVRNKFKEMATREKKFLRLSRVLLIKNYCSFQSPLPTTEVSNFLALFGSLFLSGLLCIGFWFDWDGDYSGVLK